MPDSILDTTKKVLGIESSYTVFDPDIIMHINSVFSTLQQLGVGVNPDESFAIEDSSSLWSEFIGDNKNINAVKSYMYLRVRLLFDPPATSFTQDAMKSQIQELEWRLNVQVDPKKDSITPPPEPEEPDLPDEPGFWSRVYKFRAKTNAVDGDPGSGKILWSDYAQISSTYINLDIITEEGLDATLGFSNLSPGNLMHIQDWGDSTDFQEWNVLSITDHNGYFTLGVEFRTAGGTGNTNFNQNLILAIRFRA